MNFDKQYQKQEEKVERALFEPNYNSMSSMAENEDMLQTRKNKPTADYRTPLGSENGHDYQSRSSSTGETNSATKKRRKKNNIRTETDEIKRLNERLHQPESTKKQDPNTYNSMLQVGEGFYNQARLIDDLIARTEEDIRQQRATIEDKEERKRKYKEICEAIYIAVENLNQQSVAIRKSLTSDCEQSTGYDNQQSPNIVTTDKGREGTMRHDNAVMIANNDADTATSP